MNVVQSHRRAQQADGSGCGEHWAEAKMANVEKKMIYSWRFGQQFVTVNTMGQTFLDSSMVKGHIGDAVDDRRR
jgi:hypothetical protein